MTLKYPGVMLGCTCRANYVVEDLGSTNGTVVSGQRIAVPYILRPGEMITLGEHTFVLFEKVVLDPDATIASLRPAEPILPEAAPAPAPSPVEPVYQAAPVTKEPVEQEYVGRIPEKPRHAKAKNKKSSSMVVILIVVVLVLLCGCIAFAIFDALDLYCNFPSIMNFLIPGACTP